LLHYSYGITKFERYRAIAVSYCCKHTSTKLKYNVLAQNYVDNE